MQPAAYGILDPGIVVRIHGGERRVCQRRPHAVLGMVPHTGTMMVETSVPSYPFVAETFSTPHYSPLVQPVAHRPLEPLVRGSNPRRGAIPIPLRNAQPLFSFRSEGHTEFRGQSLASMDTVWRAAFRQRFFSPSVSRCAGTARSGKGAASAFNRAERDANGDYANRVGDGLQNRAWLGSTPAITSHRIRAKRGGYMPPSVSGFAVGQDSSDR